MTGVYKMRVPWFKLSVNSRHFIPQQIPIDDVIAEDYANH